VDLAVTRPLAALALLQGREIRRQGERLGITPPLGAEEVGAVKPLKPALLAAVEDGEALAGEEVLANPYRLAAVLLALYPLEGLLEGVSFQPGKTERVLAPNPQPALRWHARNRPKPERLHLGPPQGRWLLEIEPPAQALLVARSRLGLEVLALSEEGMARYLSAAARGRLAPEELFLETRRGVFTEPSWAGALALLSPLGEGGGPPGLPEAV